MAFQNFSGEGEQPKARGLVLRCLSCCAIRVSSQGASKRLELAAWQCAWDRYSLAAHVTGQLTVSQAAEHKAVVLEIAFSAGTEGRRMLLGVLYDEVVR